MSLSPLLPLAVPAIGSLAAEAIDTIADGVSFAQALLQPGTRAETQGAPNNEFLSINDTKAALRSVRGATDKALEDFRDVVLEKLEKLGIDTSQPIRLRGDGQGRVIVDGDHPQRAAIEQIFREDMSLTGLFNYVSANYRILDARGKHHIDASDDGFFDQPRPNVIDDAQFELTIDAGRIEAAVNSRD